MWSIQGVNTFSFLLFDLLCYVYIYLFIFVDVCISLLNSSFAMGVFRLSRTDCNNKIFSAYFM